MRFPQVVIFHSKFSKDKAEFPLFVLKTLSTYSGGRVLQRNAEKVILVEKQFAIRSFGQGPGVHALRSKYFLTYVAYALSCGIRDPKLLPVFGKRELLRSQRPIPPRVEVLEDRARSSPHSASTQEQGESSSKRMRIEEQGEER